MKRLVTLALVVLLVAAGGLGGWWIWVRGGDPMALLAAAGGEAEAPAPLHMELDPFVVSVMQEGRVTRIVTLVIAVEVSGEVGRDYVNERETPLRNAILSELHRLMALEAVRARGPAAALVKRRLRRAGARVLGAGILRRVLVQAVQSRPA